jgi:hypothetical protein
LQQTLSSNLKRHQKGLLLQVGQLLGQFGLNSGRPGAAAITASVQAAVELDGIQPPIHGVLYDFPNGF